jgi:hypothetical protein
MMADTFSLTQVTGSPADYATYTQIAAAMPDVTLGATYQAILTTLATRASRMIDSFLVREPGAFYVTADTTRYFDGTGDDLVGIDEIAAAPTSVSVAETGDTTYTAWAATDYICWPYNALLMGYPYVRLDVDVYNGTKYVWSRYKRAVKVVGKFGFSTTVPEEIAQACIIQASRWFKRGQQAWQDTGAVAELGQLRYVKELDPDVKALLNIPKFQRYL